MTPEVVATLVVAFLATAIPGVVISSLKHKKTMQALADQKEELDIIGLKLDAIKFLQEKRRELFDNGNFEAADKLLEAIRDRLDEVQILNDIYKSKYGRQ